MRCGDVGVVGTHQQTLTGVQIGSGEGHLLLAGVGDRVRRDDVVDLPVLDQCLALPGRRFLPVDLVRPVAELAGDIGGDVDVESSHRPVGILHRESGLVEFRSDGDRVIRAAASGQCGHQRETQQGYCEQTPG
jgi:hypothetical protein